MTIKKADSGKHYPEEYARWKKDPTPENTDALLRKLSPIINSAVKSYGAGSAGLQTRARILALKAAGTFDPSKSVKLDTHVMSQLRQLSRVARMRSNVIHIPENVFFDRRKLDAATADFVNEKGREPSHAELADRTGIPLSRIKKTLEYKNRAVPSSMGVSDKGDHMNDVERDPYDMWVDYVYHDMDDKDRKIFEHVAGYNGAKILPKNEIAKKLGMTPAGVSNRVNNIVRKLEEMPSDGF